MESMWSLFRRGGMPFVSLLAAASIFITPYNSYLCVLFCVMCLLLVVEELYRMDLTTIGLGFFSLLLAYSIHINGLTSSKFDLVNYMVCPPVFYLFGRNIISRMNCEKHVVKFWLVFIIAMCWFVWLNVILDVVTTGNWVLISRKMTTVIGGFYCNATGYGLTVSIGLIGIGYFFVGKGPWTSLQRWTFLLMGILSVFTVCHLVNRTGLILVVASSGVLLAYFNKHRVHYILYVLLAIVVIIAFLYLSGIITDEMLGAYRYRSDNVEDNDAAGLGGRSERWVDAVEKIFIYPMGWANERATFHDYVHNFWLDVLRISGTIPFITILLLSIKPIWISVKLFMLRDGNEAIAMMLAVHTVLFLSCMVEPVTDGMTMYMYIYFMYWGMQYELYDRMTKDPTFK